MVSRETLGHIVPLIVHIKMKWFAFRTTVQFNQLGRPGSVSWHEKNDYSFRCWISKQCSYKIFILFGVAIEFVNINNENWSAALWQRTTPASRGTGTRKSGNSELPRQETSRQITKCDRIQTKYPNKGSGYRHLIDRFKRQWEVIDLIAIVLH